MVKLSLVVPCYNEGENVIPFHEAALNAFQDCGYEIEIVYIDDGSRDATLHNLKKVYARKDCRVKIVSFSRNFGKEAGHLCRLAARLRRIHQPHRCGFAAAAGDRSGYGEHPR